MKKIILCLLFLIGISFSSTLNIQALRDDKIMMEYHIEDVKNWKWMQMSNGAKFIRVELYGNNFLDLPLNDYDVKILK